MGSGDRVASTVFVYLPGVSPSPSDPAGEWDVQPPAHQSTGEGLEGCIRGGRRHPPQYDSLVPRDVQAEPWCEDRPHGRNFGLKVSQALMRLGKGGSGPLPWLESNNALPLATRMET